MEVPIPAARGLIFDRAGRPLAINVPSWTVKARKADLPGERTGIVLGEVARVTGVDPRELRRRLDAFTGSPYDLVPLARGIDRNAALVLGERRDELPGIVVEAEPVRQYLDEHGKVDGTLMAHLVGYTGAVAANELDTLEPQGYLPDDSIGRAGVERTFEKELRGTYGSELVERTGRWAAGRRARDRAATGGREEPPAHDRFRRAARRDERAPLGDGRGRAQAGGDDRDEPPDRRDPGDGLAAVV